MIHDTSPSPSVDQLDLRRARPFERHRPSNRRLVWIERLLFAVAVVCLGVWVAALAEARWTDYHLRRELAVQQAHHAGSSPPAQATPDGATAAAEPTAPAPPEDPSAHPPAVDESAAAALADLPDSPGEAEPDPVVDTDPKAPSYATPTADAWASLGPGDLVGKIDVPRLGISAVILEGTEGRALRRGVGHLTGTPLPGHPGNSAVAGHRDTHFRGLGSIREGDRILVDTPTGQLRYRVDDIQIVEPDAVEVLADRGTETLTLVTCYPFNYLGTAPQRYIVHARPESTFAPFARTAP